MNTPKKFSVVILIGVISIFVLAGCSSSGGDDPPTPSDSSNIILLHHSTGEVIWNGGVQAWFAQNAPQHSITEQWFPGAVDGNYPYDYWNIWVNYGVPGDATLEMLTAQYHVIVFKHCFPVSEIGADIGAPDVASEDRRLENYYLQYNALKAKLREFPNTRFIIWTGAVQVEGLIDVDMATRTRAFFDWVKNVWDERGDNIYIWDFYELETEGGLYLRPEYASSPDDAHPTAAFAQRVAPLLCQRIVNVLNGIGDNTSLTGE